MPLHWLAPWLTPLSVEWRRRTWWSSEKQPSEAPFMPPLPLQPFNTSLQPLARSGHLPLSRPTRGPRHQIWTCGGLCALLLGGAVATLHTFGRAPRLSCLTRRQVGVMSWPPPHATASERRALGRLRCHRITEAVN